jgi:diadenylate cyclase
VVLVVSEETGQIALVRNGEVYRNLSSSDLRVKLNQFLFDTDQRATPAAATAEKSVSPA